MICAVVVGLGSWGRNLIYAVREHDAVIRFTGANTRHAEPVTGVCREHDLRWADDFDALLATLTRDAVVLATPRGVRGGAGDPRRRRENVRVR